MLIAIISLIFGYMLIAPMPLMGQDDCKVVLDAMTKAIDTPNHTYTTTNMSGVTQTVESISTGGTIYAKVNGKWSAGTTTKEMKAITEKNRQTNKPTCRYLNDEPVNGEMAAVYTLHNGSPTVTDSKTWISKTKGLPLRSETDLDSGKNHISTRYEYGNVKPPI
ncbi:MAG TPA: hypothetical protein VG096_03070 [Bryobacteraceae bacterium]|jgi:hypothetical protein|nr:hypothetical protein [Bryobacteraceae bacterium]